MYENQQDMMNTGGGMVYCPCCGGAISAGATFCGRCGTQVNVAQPKNYCWNCRREVSANAAFCNSCGAQMYYTYQQSGYVYNNVPQMQELPMRWFKFIIYVQLWLTMVVCLCTGVLNLTGAIYYTTGYSPAMIYEYWGTSLKIVDVVYGGIALLIAVFAVVTRQYLAGYKVVGPRLYYILQIVQLSVSLLYNIVIGVITQNDESITNSITGIIIPIALLSATMTYFKKRKHLFVY